MTRKMKKFSAGGAQGRYDRRMADIEKDFKKDSSGKTGKAAEVLAAKRAQRIADAKDDLAKRTGADRTATRAAERAAEDTLRSTRRQGKSLLGVESFMKSPEFSTKVASEKAPAAPAEAKPTTTSTASKPASKPVVKKVVTPTAKPKPSAADIARQKAKIGASNAPSDQGFSKKSKVLGASNRSGTTGTGAPATGGTALRGRPMTGGLFSNLFTTSDAYRKSQEAKYGKAKGDKIMKYAKGGATPPKPSDADRARSKKHLDELKKLKPTAEEGKVAGSANRSEGPGYKKGGKMATKFGAAMKKKSADTKGRAMVKKATGGMAMPSRMGPQAPAMQSSPMPSRMGGGRPMAGINRAKGGSIDGCAVKGKTKTSMLARGGAAKMRSRDSYGGATFKKGGKTC